MKKTVIVLSAFSAIFLFSCKKTADVSNSGLEFQMKAANTSSVVNRTMATVSWQSGFINANEIRFEAKQNGTETKFRSKVEQHVDLFASLSSIGNITIPSGTFDEAEFKVEAASTSTEPAFQLQGSIDNTPVIFKVDSSLEIKAEQEQVTLSGSNTALSTIDLSGLTAGLSSTDLTHATQTGGVIVISSTSNSDLFNIIVANLQKQGETEVEMHHH